MRMLNEIVKEEFKRSVHSWLLTKRGLCKGLAYHNYFIEINSELIVDVRLNCLYEKYFEKHVAPDPELYITKFMEEMKPALVDTLKACKFDGNIFVISFSGRGIKTTRFARISILDK